MLGLFGRLLATSEAVCQSSRPAWIEAASGNGGVQASGASSTKSTAGRIFRPESVRKFKASTRYPLATPSVLLNRNRTVFVPLTTVLLGNASVIVSVAKPPPIPPKLLPGPAMFTVLLLRDIQGLEFTWTLASSAYRSL